jgi:hypothetical protein
MINISAGGDERFSAFNALDCLIVPVAGGWARFRGLRHKLLRHMLRFCTIGQLVYRSQAFTSFDGEPIRVIAA